MAGLLVTAHQKLQAIAHPKRMISSCEQSALGAYIQAVDTAAHEASERTKARLQLNHAA